MKDKDQTWLFVSVKMYSTDQIQDMWNLDILHLYCFSPVTGNADFVQEYYFGDCNIMNNMVLTRWVVVYR
jgi:hypothetical protein